MVQTSWAFFYFVLIMIISFFNCLVTEAIGLRITISLPALLIRALPDFGRESSSGVGVGVGKEPHGVCAPWVFSL